MKRCLAAGVAAAVLGVAFATATPASAAGSAPSSLVDVTQAYPGESFTQYRRYRGRPGRVYEGRRYGYDRGYRRPYRGGGAAAAGVIGGLAAGALLGGAIAAQGAQAPVVDQGYLEYCSQRYRSFDPDSGTYLGYDGVRRPCEYP